MSGTTALGLTSNMLERCFGPSIGFIQSRHSLGIELTYCLVERINIVSVYEHKEQFLVLF